MKIRRRSIANIVEYLRLTRDSRRSVRMHRTGAVAPVHAHRARLPPNARGGRVAVGTGAQMGKVGSIQRWTFITTLARGTKNAISNADLQRIRFVRKMIKNDNKKINKRW